MGATNDSSSVELNSQNVKHNGVCMNAGNVSKTANVTITPASGCGTLIVDPADPIDPEISFTVPTKSYTIGTNQFSLI